MKIFKVSKVVTSIILSLAIIFSGIGVITVTVDASTSVGSSYATFDTNKTYYIWLKDEPDNTDAPLKEIRRSIFRWNINGDGTGHNAVVHLDYQYGKTCTMEFKDVGDGYYGIHYKNTDNPYWIDTKGDNTETGEVLHQNTDELKNDKYNQHFKFIPVPGEKDTYYIYCRKANLYVGIENNKIEREAKLVTANESDRKKWIITSEDYILTGQEENLCGSKNGVYKPTKGAPIFTLNPENYNCDVNVNNDGDLIGSCLHLFYIGTSSKITAEWVESKNAYRLRSFTLQENSIDNTMGKDFVWDVDDQSVDEHTPDKNVVIHLWNEKETSHASQFWRFIPIEGKKNVYYIYNVNSCLYLSIEGGYSNNKSNDRNDFKLVQSKTAFPWELHLLNQNGLTEYTGDTTDEEINPGNWMSKLPDSMYLSELNIPGTHDAGATHMLTDVDNQVSSSICHQLYLDEQLNAGVRAWDLRIDRKSSQSEEDPNIVHGESAFICRNRNGDILELDEVMQTAKDFLASHPKETIVITLKGDGKSFTDLLGNDDDVATQVLKYIKNTSYPIYRPVSGNGGKVPTLGQVRGKIVFVRRLSLSDSYINDLKEQSKSLSYSLIDAFGPDASKWDNNHYADYKHAQQVGSSNVYVQDNYGEGDANKKLQYFTGTIDDATKNKLTADGNAYLFNYSAATDNLSQPREINSNLMSESRLNQPTSLSDKKTIGMVMTNYIDAKLSTRIYMTNFITEHSHKYNDNGFCTICGQYQPATLNSNNVYEIGNAGQFFWFASLVNNDRTFADFDKQNAGANAVLVKDINLENREWSPVRDYTGVFDGQNHTISGLKITKTPHDTGLFRSVYGTIKNFTVKGEMIISADGDYIGGAVGYADGAKITNVASYVNISNTAGALKHVGGVIGYIANKDTFVDKCVYYGIMDIKDSHDCIGGIVGYSNAGARISNCANYGTVSASKNDAYVGGILGYVNNSKPTVKDCYNYGTVSNGESQKYCGAIIGWARNYTSANISNNYYLGKSSSLAFGSGSKSGATAVSKTAYDFSSGEVAYLLNHSVTDGSQVWYQNIDNGETPDDYPVFDGGTVYYLEYKDSYSNTYSDEPEPDAFDKDENGNFIIKTYDDLVKLSELVRSDYKNYGSADYILVNNIKATDDSVWTHGIGCVSDGKPFNGTFNGNGYCIIGLNVNSSEYGGLFEVIGENGTVKDLFVFDCDFMSSSKVAGGIAAVNKGTIDHCISGVNLTTGDIVFPNITINASLYNSNIKGDSSGGIVGENSGTITGCRNSAVVSGTQCGGIASVNTGKIYGCAN
ncbi:MAG: phosphatidylinositol-specific phospholipase C domain-containing protein, partial [Acutalibacteraceae bacterium]